MHHMRCRPSKAGSEGPHGTQVRPRVVAPSTRSATPRALKFTLFKTSVGPRLSYPLLHPPSSTPPRPATSCTIPHPTQCLHPLRPSQKGKQGRHAHAPPSSVPRRQEMEAFALRTGCTLDRCSRFPPNSILLATGVPHQVGRGRQRRCVSSVLCVTDLCFKCFI